MIQNIQRNIEVETSNNNQKSGDKATRLAKPRDTKAYMGGQTSSSSSPGFVARNEKDCLDRGMLIGKSSVASPSRKPSPSWHGIKSSEQSGFTTPQSQQERFQLQSFPRTPYTRTILSNSKAKLSKGRDGGLIEPSRTRQRATLATKSHDAATKDDEIPQYSFDGNREGDKSTLVFVFSSMSEERINEPDDVRLGIKFKFGSNKLERIIQCSR